MRQIVFATGNMGKLREASEILGEGFSLVTPAEIGLPEDIPETGKTLEENSLQKARYIFEHKGCDCFSDDTGLEVEALGGAPGVYTARFAGPEKDFNKNMGKVLEELAHQESRIPGVSRRQFEGILNGAIARSKSGHGGFGYDPIFIPDEYPDRTLADITEEQKNAISHRGKALRAMAGYLATFR